MQATHTNPRREQRRALRRREKILHTLLKIGLGLLILGGLIALAFSNPGPKVSGPARAGEPMPDFSLTDLAGDTVRLSTFSGRPILINAWATWCPPCRAEMPDLHTYYLNHQAEGFVILAINAGETSSPVESFIAEMGFTFPVLLDPGQAVLNQLGVHSFPTSILVDRTGAVHEIHVGMLTAAMLEEKITPLLTP